MISIRYPAWFALGLALGVAALSCSSSSDAPANSSGASHAGGSDGGDGFGGSSTPAGGTAGSGGAPAGVSGSSGGLEGGLGGAKNDGGGAAAGGLGEPGGDGPCTAPGTRIDCRPPSCAGLVGDECQGHDCCATHEVMGGTFQQGEPDAFASTVDSFRLDELEVTVGRFRRFVSDYDAWRKSGNPLAGAGQSSSIVASGWSSEWTTQLPASAAQLETNLDCGNAMFSTWAEAGNEALPINCVDWYTALAFCIWDGGRLPTDTEAEYAAVGGSKDYLYPWGDSPALTDLQDDSASYAVYSCLADGSSAAGSCTLSDLPAVGSMPKGRGQYQQLDLVGSVWEWSLDWWQEAYPTAAQSNYAKLDTGKYRNVRGGSWDNTAKLVSAASRTGMTPETRYDTVGLRCARNITR